VIPDLALIVSAYICFRMVEVFRQGRQDHDKEADAEGLSLRC
jgi:hypothetical protein